MKMQLTANARDDLNATFGTHLKLLVRCRQPLGKYVRAEVPKRVADMRTSIEGEVHLVYVTNAL